MMTGENHPQISQGNTDFDVWKNIGTPHLWMDMAWGGTGV
jgi:hypothetical protein